MDKTCKNCKSWTPDGWHDAINSLNMGSCKSVGKSIFTCSGKADLFFPENFGCIHFDKKEEKVCSLKKDENCWLLNVDGHLIPFQSRVNAKYFADHYEKLGYEIIWKEA
jgi:hypothetical protein